MFKILKYFKPFTISMITVIALLVVQAVCDLSLPDYTSDIVNVGIQQSGVENAVPEVIRETELDKLMLFMTDEEKEIIEKNYNLVDRSNLSNNEYSEKINDYPVIENEPVYELNTEEDEVIEELNSIMSTSIMKVSAIDMAQNEQMIPDIPQDMDVWTLLAYMPDEQLDEIKKEMDDNFKELDVNIIEQSAILYVQKEYEDVGVDIEKLQTNYIFMSGAKMLGIALISMTSTVVVGFLAARVAAGVCKNLRKDVFGKVVEFSNVEFEKFSTASLITRSTNDIQQIQMLAVILVRIVFYAPILGVGGVIKVLNTDTSMAWIIGVAIVSILSLVSVLFGLAIPRFKIIQNLVDKLNLVTRESLTGMLVIRAFNTQGIEEERFDETNTLLRKTNTFVNRTMAIMMPAMMLIMNLVTVTIVWVGANRIDLGAMQVGDMMAFIQYAMQIIMAFLMISMLSVILPRASVSAARIGEVLSTETLIKNPSEPKVFDISQEGCVEFKNVSFKYPDAEDNVLNDISFTAKPGQTTAFIGSTGSGKSTLINLIPRFFDVTEGEILVNGINIKEVNQHELRDKIGYIPQKGILFSGTIESNIKYGGADVSTKDMEKASEIAQATEFIQKKEEGFDSPISQGGTNVSGGQKQRLSIARALAKKASIYIFDDSFSALDLKTDAALRKKLNSEVKDATVLIVGQRISTIKHADQIIVLDEGNMVGIGTHDELMGNCEVYNQIALSQLSKEELGHE